VIVRLTGLERARVDAAARRMVELDGRGEPLGATAPQVIL